MSSVSNEEERRKDGNDREAIVGHLKEQLRNGDKSLVGNKGYRRYLKVEGSGHFVIDEKQVKAEERYDGIWVLGLTPSTIPSQIDSGNHAHLPQVQPSHSWPCVLQLPCFATQNRAGAAHEICQLTVRMGAGASRS